MAAPPERVLAVKLADLGDALTALPALRALGETYPGIRLDLLTSPGGAAVLAGLPAVSHFVTADRHWLDSPRSLVLPRTWRRLTVLTRQLRAGRYDHVLLMHHLSTGAGAAKWRLLAAALRPARSIGLDNGRGGFLDQRVKDEGFGALHEVEYGLRLAQALGARAAGQCLELTITSESERQAESLLAPIGNGPFAVIHPGSGHFSLARRWPPERFAAVADALQREHRVPVVIVGGAHDGVDTLMRTAAAPHLNLAGRTSVMTLAAVLRRSSLFVGGDSGVMHLATAAGTPVLALFGPTDRRAWGPWRPPGCGAAPAAVIQGPCPYDGPCLYTGHTVGRRDGCPGRDCLQAISVEQVVERVRELSVL